ncbi:4-amino-4-deoxy-L-arabinose transferase [Pseudomonas sp. M47T1]|uniref:lipid IV(A) 4-amino-4-deoxy-L-arabinosyltransferase n=1 Tax=Pseudomonas sp. M47T1 TaxID=1179778 RepID=UPI0002606EE9|nr:lipid IV(A) 4-amino-4-deoxy-L-arabinosyltransferase [Pseudomonas sp. M47T1]EIK97016.1 4-amino-4-deoxy-L-arabinose transferase [Pseudomonas sp. M47T1]
MDISIHRVPAERSRVATARHALLLLLAAFMLAYVLPLPFHGLWIPDETRYAQISQEMLLSGHWASPHFMGLRYFEKPAGGYWLIALGQAVFGQNLFGVRIASALGLGLSTLLAYLIAARLWQSPAKSLACALVYMSFGLIAGQAGYANLDPLFTLWVNLSLVALWYAQDSRTRRGRLWSWALVGAACAMGMMTKGFLALLLPVLIAVPYMIWQRRLGELVSHGLIAVAVATLLTLPWALIIHQQEADFWRFFFWHEHVRRFAGDDAQHARPIWFYLPMLVVSSLPWALLMPKAFAQGWQQRRVPAIVFLLLWFTLPLVFFSLSRGKLPTYIMPCLLPLALLIGHALVDRVQQGAGAWLRANAVFNLVLGSTALLALVGLQVMRPLYIDEPVHLVLISVALVAFVAANALAVARPLRHHLAPALAMLTLVAVLPAAVPNSITDSETPDTFVAQHLDALRQADTLVSNELGAASGMAWHLGRPHVVLYNVIGEAQYGLDYPDAQGRAVDMDGINPWLARAREHGSVAMLLRVRSDTEKRELAILPADATRYQRGEMTLLFFPQKSASP